MRQGATPPLLGGLARSPALGAPANGQVRPTHRSAQAPPKRLAAGPSPAGGASLRPPYGEGIFAGHSTFPSTIRSPERSQMTKGKVRRGPAAIGCSRVAVSNTRRSFRREARVSVSRPGAISGRLQAPFQVRQLPPRRTATFRRARFPLRSGRRSCLGPLRPRCADARLLVDRAGGRMAISALSGRAQDNASGGGGRHRDAGGAVPDCGPEAACAGSSGEWWARA